MESRTVTVRRRFTALDKVLLFVIVILVLITVVLARTTLNLARDTMDLTDQVSTISQNSALTIERLEVRVAALEQERSLKRADVDISLVSVQSEAEAPRTLECITVDCGLSSDLLLHVSDMSEKYDVPVASLLTLMYKESGFGKDIYNTNTNESTDVGIMQINSCNWGWLQENYNLDVVNDEYDNIEAGALVLAMYWSKYTPEEAFSAYNMGEGGMKQYGVNSYGREANQIYLNYSSILGG